VAALLQLLYQVHSVIFSENFDPKVITVGFSHKVFRVSEPKPENSVTLILRWNGSD
jgi:hypothetical protein